jgi:hypothetical protein
MAPWSSGAAFAGAGHAGTGGHGLTELMPALARPAATAWPQCSRTVDERPLGQQLLRYLAFEPQRRSRPLMQFQRISDGNQTGLALAGIAQPDQQRKSSKAHHTDGIVDAMLSRALTQ